jgi:hypothetical protein
VSGINSHGGGADVGVSGDVNLENSAGVEGNVGTEAEYGMEVGPVGRSDVDGNDDGAVSLSAGNLK